MLDSNPAFDLTHEKSMVVDDTTAFVKSLNWQSENLTETRDYAIITSDPHEVAEIIDCFEADWSRQDFASGKQRAADLVPGKWPRTDYRVHRRLQALAVVTK